MRRSRVLLSSALLSLLLWTVPLAAQDATLRDMTRAGYIK